MVTAVNLLVEKAENEKGRLFVPFYLSEPCKLRPKPSEAFALAMSEEC